MHKLWSRNFILACIANFLSCAAFYFLMPVLPIYLTKVIHIPDSQIGIVLASYSLALLVARPFSGFLVDQLARKPLYLFAILFFSVTFGGYFFGAGVASFIVIRLIHGATWGLLAVSGNTIAIDIIPSEQRGQGIGVYGFMTSLAMALGPIFSIHIYKNAGYNTLITCCMITGFISLIIASFIQAKPHIKTHTPPLSLDRFILVKALPIAFSLFLSAIGYGMVVSYGVLFGEEMAIRHTDLLFLFFAAGIGLSRLVSGHWVDKGYIHWVSLFSLFLLGVSLFIFSVSKNEYIFCIMALFVGAGVGSMVPAYQTLIINMGTHQQRGTANSTYLTAFDIGIGVGTLAGGVIAQYFNYSTAFTWSAILVFISIPVYYFWAKPWYEKYHIK